MDDKGVILKHPVPSDTSVTAPSQEQSAGIPLQSSREFLRLKMVQWFREIWDNDVTQREKGAGGRGWGGEGHIMSDSRLWSPLRSFYISPSPMQALFCYRCSLYPLILLPLAPHRNPPLPSFPSVIEHRDPPSHSHIFFASLVLVHLSCSLKSSCCYAAHSLKTKEDIWPQSEEDRGGGVLSR